MRKLVLLLSVAALFSITMVVAAEVKTITGEAVCAKCALGEPGPCQNTITTDEGGKTVTYYLTKNEYFKTSHGPLGICKAEKGAGVKVKATGEVAEKGGKMTLTPTAAITKAD